MCQGFLESKENDSLSQAWGDFKSELPFGITRASENLPNTDGIRKGQEGDLNGISLHHLRGKVKAAVFNDLKMN